LAVGRLAQRRPRRTDRVSHSLSPHLRTRLPNSDSMTKLLLCGLAAGTASFCLWPNHGLRPKVTLAQRRRGSVRSEHAPRRSPLETGESGRSSSNSLAANRAPCQSALVLEDWNSSFAPRIHRRKRSNSGPLSIEHHLESDTASSSSVHSTRPSKSRSIQGETEADSMDL